MFRVVFAFFCVPVVVVFAIPLGVSAFSYLSGGDTKLSGSDWGFFLWYGLPVSTFATLIIGFPLFLVFRHFNWLTWWQVSLTGAAIGVIVSGFSSFAFLFGPCGFFSGLLFWVLAVYQNRKIRYPIDEM